MLWDGVKFIFPTKQYCHVVTQALPVEILFQLLFDASDPESTAVRTFFQVLQEDQACATALILACILASWPYWAARAFFLLGGDVKVSPSHLAHPILSPTSPFVVNSPGHLNSTPSNRHHQQPHFTFSSPLFWWSGNIQFKYNFDFSNENTFSGRLNAGEESSVGHVTFAGS